MVSVCRCLPCYPSRSGRCKANSGSGRKSCVTFTCYLLFMTHGAPHALSSSLPHALAFMLYMACALSMGPKGRSVVKQEVARQLCVVANDDFATKSSAIASSLSIPLVLEESLHNNRYSHVLKVLPYKVLPGTTTYSLGIQSVGESRSVQYAGSSLSRTNQSPKQKTKMSKFQFENQPFVIDAQMY